MLYIFSLFTWRISLWPNCGFWSVVAFVFWVTFKSVAFLSVTQLIKSHNWPKATIRPQSNAPCKQANSELSGDSLDELSLHWTL